MKTYHIHIMGQVQGVGFRPFVFRLAKKSGMRGEVHNGTDGVHIIFNSTETASQEFYHALIKEAPVISHITSSFILETKDRIFSDFRIGTSEYKERHTVLLTPDLAMCPECRKELTSDITTERRAGYPFITCTVCGPRYSIIRQLPFDRENTSMVKFKMCSTCETENREPSDRRYYSQTNSCPDCGISLLPEPGKKEIPDRNYESIIQQCVISLQKGKIIAVKGIGGYLLICDAASKESIRRLRSLKDRPSKPFALMYPSAEMLKGDVLLSHAEEKILTSPSSPIAILQLKKNPLSGICASEIAPGLSQIGVMLPYAPVYALLLRAYNKPVIATSANISGSPIIFRENNDRELLGKIADLIISNNREIVVSQDDSVVKFSPFTLQKIVFRRSRGLAPAYFNPNLTLPPENVLATGALLKSTFTLTHQRNIYISQYMGDLDNYEVQDNYRQCLDHFFNLLNTRPEIVLTDKHPDYFSTAFGSELSKATGIPIKHYQHHQAHFAAVLGENDLLNTTQPVLGVIWDGVGEGNDGHAWGGEFFIYKNLEFERCAHFSYFDYLIGDKMSREPRISALSATAGLEGAEALLKKKFNSREWSFYQKVLAGEGNIRTSSAGRIFDAVASLLDLSDKSAYEGEAAMYLENLALDHFRKNGLTMVESYFDDDNLIEISTRRIFEKLMADIKIGKDKGFIAAKFHYSLAILVKKMAEKTNIKNIAFSGGVYQNALLVDLIKKEMSGDWNLYFHRQLSPNDECISFGQLCCYMIEKQKLQYASSENKKYVLSHSG